MSQPAFRVQMRQTNDTVDLAVGSMKGDTLTRTVACAAAEALPVARRPDGAAASEEATRLDTVENATCSAVVRLVGARAGLASV